VVVAELVDLAGDERRLVVLVVGDVADDRLAVAESVHSRLSLRAGFFAMTAFAADRMVWVER
jgi:hypothetical protein